MLKLRNVMPDDHQSVVSVIPRWWDGRDLSGGVLKVFFHHFQNSSFLAEKDDLMVGFLVGFLSQTQMDEGYIHFAGVHPEFRCEGIGRRLYDLFFQVCRNNARTVVKSCTSPVNRLSIDFHTRLGFVMEEGDAIVEGMPVITNYLRENDPKIVFRKELR